MVPVPTMATVLSEIVTLVPHSCRGLRRKPDRAGYGALWGSGQDACSRRSCSSAALTGSRWCLGRFEGGREQVTSGQAAVGPPLVGDVEDLLLDGNVIELIGGLNGLAQRQVAGKDDVLAAERNEHGSLHGPRADP